MYAKNQPSCGLFGAVTAAIWPAQMRLVHAAILIIGYVALDWASFIHALHGLNITPWNPAPAVGLVFVMRFGARVGAVLFVAVLLAEFVVRDLPESLLLNVLLAATVALGYTATGALMRRRMTLEKMFEHRRELFVWVVLVIVGTLVVSAVFVSILSLFGSITPDGWASAVTRYWIGDGIGVLVTMPLLAMLMNERGRVLLSVVMHRWETLAYSMATVGVVALSVGLSAEADFKYFYVAFLPIVWAALRHGQAGAVIAAAFAQLAIIAVVQLRGFAAVTVFEIQALAVVLVLLGFLVGVVIDEQRRMSNELRQSLRLAAAGEMAGALAHELNQPLTAMSAYGAACEDLINQGERGDRLLDMVQRLVAESHRTSAVVTRLRDFFRTGDTRLEHVGTAEVLQAVVDAFTARAQRNKVRLSAVPLFEATLLADRLQIEVVLRNLVANAFDAAESMNPESRWVKIASSKHGPDQICISIEDSGPGLRAEAIGRLFEPFRSSKSSGLGLGLAISRSIVDAHGGELWAEVGTTGVFKLTLPVELRSAHEQK